MAMNARLLRPRPTIYTPTDANALAYVLSVESGDGQKLESNTRKAIDTFVKGLKTDNVWAALTHCCILAGARTIAGATKPLKGTAPTSVAFTSSDYDRKTGLLGSTANTKYLNSNVNNNTFTQDDFHMGVWVATAQTSGSTLYMMGAGGGGTGSSELFSNGGSLQFRNQTGSAQAVTANSDTTTGLVASTRSLSTTFDMRYGSTLTNAGSRASQTLFNGNIHVFRTSSFSTLFSNARLRWYSMGAAIDTAKLSARLTTLYSDLSAAIL